MGQPFKLAIIDSDMPGTSGFELARPPQSNADSIDSALEARVLPTLAAA